MLVEARGTLSEIDLRPGRDLRGSHGTDEVEGRMDPAGQGWRREQRGAAPELGRKDQGVGQLGAAISEDGSGKGGMETGREMDRRGLGIRPADDWLLGDAGTCRAMPPHAQAPDQMSKGERKNG